MTERDSRQDAGKAILVTGASGAIGFEIAAQASGEGYVVGVHGSSPASTAQAMDRLHERGATTRLVAAPADFTESGAIEAMVTRFAENAGRVDAVIHCGVTGAPEITGPFAQTNPEGFGEHAALVLGSFQRLCHAALPHLSKQGGTIVGFASDAGRFAAPHQAVVGAAFGGIMSFVRNLSIETARDSVRVHCIAPTFVAQTPTFAAHSKRADAAQARAGLGLPTPADIAPLALFLCSPGAQKITGQVISVNGGLSA